MLGRIFTTPLHVSRGMDKIMVPFKLKVAWDNDGQFCDILHYAFVSIKSFAVIF